MDEAYICLPCPHCQCYIQLYLREMACQIYRHGAQRATFAQLNPHEAKETCDELSARETIYGCGKPFRAVRADDGEYSLEVCDYI
jgi:hypothetical protein